MHFAINSRQVMSETIDGETIVIHLGTGSYYSLQQVAADVWAAIARGADQEQVLDEIVASYDVTREEAESTIAPLLRDLEGENLIVQSANGAVYEPVSTAGERAAFAAPMLEKHTDMQDIILLDPVHEVDDRGWPHVAEAAAG
jgi:hypothetical protein